MLRAKCSEILSSDGVPGRSTSSPRSAPKNTTSFAPPLAFAASRTSATEAPAHFALPIALVKNGNPLSPEHSSATEHGLEQEFNSLDNQREASEAYIKSQAHAMT